MKRYIRRVLNVELQYPLFLPPGTPMCSLTRILHWALVPRIFIRVSLHRYDWLNHWPCDWTQCPKPLTSLEEFRPTSKPQPSNYMVCLSAMISPILNHLLSINSHVLEGPTMFNKGNLSKGLEAASQEPRTKISQRFCYTTVVFYSQ